MSTSLFDQLFNCCEVPDCTNVSQISNDHSTCSNNSNSKGTTNGREAYYVNTNKSVSHDAQKKYSFIESPLSNNQSIINNNISDNFFNKSNINISNINDNSVNNNNKQLNTSHNSNGANSLNSSSFFNKHFFLSDNIIVDEEIEYSPKLKISGDGTHDDLFFGKELIIDAAGEENGLRNKRDGITLFGTHKEYSTTLASSNRGKTKFDIDVILHLDNLIYESIHQKVFAIEYSRIDSNYYIHNIYRIKDKVNSKPKELVLYVKINHEHQLNPSFISSNQIQTNNGMINYFLFGSILTVVNVLNNDEINIKVFNEKGKNVIIENTFKRDEDNNENNIITIGRTGCIVNIEHKTISRIHCVISYNEYYNRWMIEDGNGKGKHSTMGTWLVLGYRGKFKLSTVEDRYEVKLLNKTFSIEINQ